MERNTRKSLDLRVVASDFSGMKLILNLVPIFCLMLALPFSMIARAGVFDLPQFVQPGNFAIGVEPELVLTDGAGLAVNAKYTQGVSDLVNVQGLIGTGGGPRQFRVGANMKFDFFPDIEGQPGIGLAAQAIYYRLSDNAGNNTGMFETTGIPYVHKTFVSDKNEIDPFLAIPIGLQFADGNYKATSTLSFGSMFRTDNQSIRYTVEVGVAINNSESYVSGGITYYH